MAKYSRLLAASIIIASLSGCQSASFAQYQSGQEITWADCQWHVLADFGADYVTAISDELYQPSDRQIEDEPLFDQLTVYSAKIDYAASALGQYVDQQLAPLFPADELKEVDGFAVRLPYLSELEKLTDWQTQTDKYGLTYQTAARLDWLADAYDGFWTMTVTADTAGCSVCGESTLDCESHYSWYVLQAQNDTMTLTSVGNNYPTALKIVVNIKKAALTD